MNEIIGVVKPLLLDEGPILRDEAEFLDRALIDKFLMIVIMSWLFTCLVSFQPRFFIFSLHQALDRDKVDDRLVLNHSLVGFLTPMVMPLYQFTQ